MPFLRPLSETAPNAAPDLRWPISGLFYVTAFVCPISAGPLAGFVTLDWFAAIIGLLVGIAISFLNAWLSDKFLDPLIAKFQRFLPKPIPRILINLVAFAWVFALSAFPMFFPSIILGNSLVTRSP